MTAIWMGVAGVRREVEAGTLELDGDPGDRRRDAAMAGPQPVRRASSAGWRK